MTTKILSRSYAHKLIASGLAREEGYVLPNERGECYVILTRFDLSATAHYRAAQSDLDRLDRLSK